MECKPNNYCGNFANQLLRNGLVVRWNPLRYTAFECTKTKRFLLLVSISYIGLCYYLKYFLSTSIFYVDVDRLPLVSSAIINVAQDTNEPWVPYITLYILIPSIETVSFYHYIHDSQWRSMTTMARHTT